MVKTKRKQEKKTEMEVPISGNTLVKAEAGELSMLGVRIFVMLCYDLPLFFPFAPSSPHYTRSVCSTSINLFFLLLLLQHNSKQVEGLSRLLLVAAPSALVTFSSTHLNRRNERIHVAEVRRSIHSNHVPIRTNRFHTDCWTVSPGRLLCSGSHVSNQRAVL